MRSLRIVALALLTAGLAACTAPGDPSPKTLPSQSTASVSATARPVGSLTSFDDLELTQAKVAIDKIVPEVCDKALPITTPAANEFSGHRLDAQQQLKGLGFRLVSTDYGYENWASRCITLRFDDRGWPVGVGIAPAWASKLPVGISCTSVTGNQTIDRMLNGLHDSIGQLNAAGEVYRNPAWKNLVGFWCKGTPRNA